MTDGLSQLAQRGRRTRDIPPPRNPARTVPVQIAPAQPAPPPEATEAAEPQPSSPTPNVDQPAQQPDATPRAKPKTDLKVVTVYLEQDDDNFLETITHTGRTSQPKTAISRSAVVRLALERLHAQMSPEQIVDELRPRGDSTTTGRKRR